jgi:hypothetical protein
MISFGTWFLDDLSEQIDIKEDDSKVTKVRRHLVIQIHMYLTANMPPSTLAIMETKSAVTYHVGSISRSNNPYGTGKFICVADGLTPHGHPSDYIIRRQTWEYFGKWEDAPSEWNQ